MKTPTSVRQLSRLHYATSLVLWLMWAVLLGVAIVGRALGDASALSVETELKTGSSLVLVVFAWLSFAATNSSTRAIAALIAVGMTLGCLGDGSPLLGSLWPDPYRTLCNMVLFGIGHIAYIRACILIRRSRGDKHAVALWPGSIFLWLVMGSVLWYFAAQTGSRHQVMRVPALAYTLLLSATVGITVGIAMSNRSFTPVAIGAILFLVSDLLLAIWIFHDVVYRPFDFVWLSYGVGQMLIVFGFAAYIHLSRPGHESVSAD